MYCIKNEWADKDVRWLKADVILFWNDMCWSMANTTFMMRNHDRKIFKD